jgi:hypothetical protein
MWFVMDTFYFISINYDNIQGVLKLSYSEFGA